MAPDLADRLRRQVKVEDLFWTDPPPGIALEAFFSMMAYLRGTAQLLWNTYSAGVRTRRQVNTFDYGLPERRWRINTSECCAD